MSDMEAAFSCHEDDFPNICGQPIKTMSDVNLSSLSDANLFCGKVYIGQTGRCLNERLKEHKQEVGRYRDGHVSIHCNDCGCQPLYDSVVVYRSADKDTREIVDAILISKAGDSCVSSPSVALTRSELGFLDAAGFHV